MMVENEQLNICMTPPTDTDFRKGNILYTLFKKMSSCYVSNTSGCTLLYKRLN